MPAARHQNRHFASCLKDAIALSGIEMSEIVERTGMRSQTIAAVLNGDVAQYSQYCVRVAQALGFEMALVPVRKVTAAQKQLPVLGQATADVVEPGLVDDKLRVLAELLRDRRVAEKVTEKEAASAMATSYENLFKLLNGKVTQASAPRIAILQRIASLFNLAVVPVAKGSYYADNKAALGERGISKVLQASLKRDRAVGEEPNLLKMRIKAAASGREFPTRKVATKTAVPVRPVATVTFATPEKEIVGPRLSNRMEKLRARLDQTRGGNRVGTPRTAVIGGTAAPILDNRDALELFYARLEPFAARMANSCDSRLLDALCVGRVNTTVSKLFEPIWRDGLVLDLKIELAANQVLCSQITSMKELRYFVQALTEGTNTRMLAGSIKVPSQALAGLTEDPAEQSVVPLFRLMQKFGVDMSVSRTNLTLAAQAQEIVAERKFG